MNQENKNRPFCHLHLHTDYSILDGVAKAEDYIKIAKRVKHPTMAITDHGNMSGTYNFYKRCKEEGIKPVIGMEAYVNDDIGEHEAKKDEGKNSHLILLVKNQKGYVNLNKLTYLSFTEGYYRSGRIKTDWLFENKEGLIVGTACLGSVFGRLMFDKKEDEAEEMFQKFVEEFGEDFYAEIQINEFDEQKRYNKFIIKLAQKYNVPIVVTGDVHYATPDDVEVQNVGIAIFQKQPVGQAFAIHARHLNYTNSEYFFWANKEYNYGYSEEFITECLDNTLKIADKCNFDFETDIDKYPKYEPTQDVIDYFKTSNTTEIIHKLAHAKLNRKLKEYQKNKIVKVDNDVIKKYKDRLDYELKVIGDKHMLDYFLVVWELIRFCNENNIATGPGRGSAASCLLSYCLDITKIDPIRFNLYFERFLNPTRKSSVDIDIDFEAGTDDRTLRFLYDKYGKERVVPVVTFGTFNERGCLKDVARALGQDAGFESDVFAVTKEMPDKFKTTLAEWFVDWPSDVQCSKRVADWLTDQRNSKILEITLKLQGQVRHLGMHAAGIVIAPSPIWEYIPVNITKGSIVTAFQESSFNKDLSELGILKLDRLKLETLNVIKDTIKLVKEKKSIDITEKVESVDLKDQNLYLELRMGNNHGIFQFESTGMNSLIKGLKPDKFDEIVGLAALFRPGPMNVGAHEEYIKNKFTPVSLRKYAHPILIPLLEETNGVLVYQEQLMFIAHEIGGMTLGEGDNLRKVMDKAAKIIAKTTEGIELTEKEKNDKNYLQYLQLWSKFKEGAKQKRLSDAEITDIEGWLAKYLGYSFNLSHSLSYSYIAMQTLFLKHYYPTEFYTALLNHPKTSGGKDKEKQWIQATILAAMSKGIEIVQPTRQSNWEWTMIDDKKIAIGFSGINGVGEVAFQEILKYNLSTVNKEEFFTIPFKKFNKASFEACLKAGIFDDWSYSREELIELRKLRIKNAKQLDLFGDTDYDAAIKKIGRNFKPTSEDDKEKEFLSVCNIDLKLMKKISRLKQKFLEAQGTIIEPITNFDDQDKYYYFYLSNIEQKLSKNNRTYYSLTIGDGTVEKKMMMWDRMYKEKGHLLERGKFYVTKFKKDKGWLSFNDKASFKVAPVDE